MFILEMTESSWAQTEGNKRRTLQVRTVPEAVLPNEHTTRAALWPFLTGHGSPCSGMMW